MVRSSLRKLYQEPDLADEHTIYLDPWAGDAEEAAARSQAAAQHGPASLP